MGHREQIHNLRMDLEEPIFNELRSKYGTVLKGFWDRATFPAKAPNTVMLVERREHPNIEFVLHNFMYFTQGQNFSLTIVCCKENEEYIRNILGRHQETTHFIIPFEDNCDRDRARNEYNNMMKDPEFWKHIDADFILSVQTDCYLRKPLPAILWEQDYAASPWAWKPLLVGGSGLTFRRKEAVLDMCKRKFAADGEDTFFAHMCLMLRKKVLPLEEAEHVFSESRFVDDPVGVHQWWTYLYQADKGIIEKYHAIYTTLHL